MCRLSSKNHPVAQLGSGWGHTSGAAEPWIAAMARWAAVTEAASGWASIVTWKRRVSPGGNYDHSALLLLERFRVGIIGARLQARHIAVDRGLRILPEREAGQLLAC